VLTGLCNKALLKGTTMRKLASAIALLLLVGGVAIAQPAKGNTNAKVKVYDFSGDTIEGDLVKPDGTDLNARDFAKHSSLIRIRKDFIPEIIKSAEDL
jgi:rhamnose utilization protein RhaD (predicted bifunctional aldolase and dehydrogenase)